MILQPVIYLFSHLGTFRNFLLPVRKCFAQGNDSSNMPINHLLYATSSFNFHPIKLKAKVLLVSLGFVLELQTGILHLLCETIIASVLQST